MACKFGVVVAIQLVDYLHRVYWQGNHARKRCMPYDEDNANSGEGLGMGRLESGSWGKEHGAGTNK